MYAGIRLRKRLERNCYPVTSPVAPNDSSRAGSLTRDYEFELPRDQIAQVPADRRDQSRLMIVDRAAGSIEHRRFTPFV